MVLQQAFDRGCYTIRYKLQGGLIVTGKRKCEGELGGGDVLDDQRLAGHQHAPLALHGVYELGDGLILGHAVRALRLGQFRKRTRHNILAADYAGGANAAKSCGSTRECMVFID